MVQKRKPARRKGEVVTPDRLLQLIDAVGVTRSAKLLGVSTTTLHKARKPGAVCSRVHEVAADGALRALGHNEPRQPDATHLVLMEYDAAKDGLVAQFSQMIGAKLLHG
jgi:hypothetical protein